MHPAPTERPRARRVALAEDSVLLREGIADLIVSKHRNGGLATVELTFQKEYPRFMSYVGDDRYQ